MPLYAVNFNHIDTFSSTTSFRGSSATDGFNKFMASEDTYSRTIRNNKLLTNLIKRSVKESKYNFLMMCNPAAIGNSTSQSTRGYLRNAFSNYLNAPYDCEFAVPATFLGTLDDTFKAIKYYNRFVSYMPRTDNLADGYASYLSNFYFLARYDGYSEDSFRLRPLFVVMVKKQFLPVIRACIISGTPIPSTYMELWVDKCLEQRIGGVLTNYKKHIKNPLVKAGVKIVEFHNLGEATLKYLKRPEFKGILEKKQWGKSVVQRFFEYSKNPGYFYKNDPLITDVLSAMYPGLPQYKKVSEEPIVAAMEQTAVIPSLGLQEPEWDDGDDEEHEDDDHDSEYDEEYDEEIPF